MISFNQLKYYSSLLQKKYRDKEKKFLVEGFKLVEEGLDSGFRSDALFLTEEAEIKTDISQLLKNKKVESITLTQNEFKRISDSVTPQGIAAIFNKPNERKLSELKDNNAVYIDKISDPGNLGTIIRNCDWFGTKEIIIGAESADLYNPKTLRASMGSVFHVNFYFINSASDLEHLKKRGYKIIATDLRGENLSSYSFPEKNILVFSSESHGPSLEVKELADVFITIQKYGKAESLNVASASAVILAKLREETL